MPMNSRESDHLGFLPEFWKMPLVACHQVVGAGGIGAFQKLVVVRVQRHLKRARGSDGVGAVADELQKLLPAAPGDSCQPRTAIAASLQAQARPKMPSIDPVSARTCFRHR